VVFKGGIWEELKLTEHPELAKLAAKIPEAVLMSREGNTA